MATALPRITARVDAETQGLLAQAAAISGMTSINAFVLNAAIDKVFCENPIYGISSVDYKRLTITESQKSLNLGTIRLTYKNTRLTHIG